MLVPEGDKAISAAQQGAELIAKSARTLLALAHVSGGEGAAAIVAPALEAATAGARGGSEIIAGIIESVGGIDETTTSVIDVNTHLIWCSVSTTAAGGLAGAATYGLIGAADQMAGLSQDKRAAAAAREDARQGGLLLSIAAQTLSAMLAESLDPQAARNHSAYVAPDDLDAEDESDDANLPVYFGIVYAESERDQVIVDEVEPDAPAARGGLQLGDEITEVDSKQVTGIASLDELLSRRAPGDVVVVGVQRGGKSLSLSVQLGKPIDDLER